MGRHYIPALFPDHTPLELALVRSYVRVRTFASVQSV